MSETKVYLINLYFAGYGIEDEKLGFVVTSYPEKDCISYLEHMEKVLDQMYEALK